MTLFDILSNDERVIVLSDKGEETIITWNQSVTLQVWIYKGSGNWEELNVRTLSNQPINFKAAKKAAQDWANE